VLAVGFDLSVPAVAALLLIRLVVETPVGTGIVTVGPEVLAAPGADSVNVSTIVS
jgi:hypothetical protein